MAQVLVMERRAVAVHYLHTGFVLNLIASMPLDLLLRGRRLDILRLPRLLKIIRMMQNKSFSQAGEDPGPKTAEGARHHIDTVACMPQSVLACLHLPQRQCVRDEAPEGLEWEAFSGLQASRRRQLVQRRCCKIERAGCAGCSA